MHEAPAAVVMYLESLTKYLRGIHTSVNDDIPAAESFQYDLSSAESQQITHPNMVPTSKVGVYMSHAVCIICNTTTVINHLLI